MIDIRFATVNDAERLLEIYTPYVEETAVSFENKVPGVVEFADRIASTLKDYPYVVAVIDDEIIGYAYAGRFKAQPAYDYAIETSVYVAQDKRRMGVGSVLYEALENVLFEQGILNVNACIAYSETNAEQTLKNASVTFHEKLGYRLVGEFHDIGFKFNQWYNIVWMEKTIGDHVSEPGEIKTIDEIRDIVLKKYSIK